MNACKLTAAVLAAAALVPFAGATAADAATTQAHLSVFAKALDGGEIFPAQVTARRQTVLPIPMGVSVQPMLDATGSTIADNREQLAVVWDPNNQGTFGFSGADRTFPVDARFGEVHTSRVRVVDSAPVASDDQLSFRLVHAPSVALSATADTVAVGDAVTYDASGSRGFLDSGSPGTIQSYDWDFDGDGTFEQHTGADTPTVAHAWSAPTNRVRDRFGRLVVSTCVTVRVTDQNFVTDSKQLCTTVLPAPKPSFTVNPTQAKAGDPISLDASATTSDQKIVDFAWDLDGNGTFEKDGGSSSAMATSFRTAGDHKLGLKVTDAAGVSATTTRTVTVIAAPAATTVNTQVASAPLVAIAKSVARGGRLTVQLAAAGTTKLRWTVRRSVTGRRVGGRCVRTSSRRGRACRVLSIVAARSAAAAPGTSTIALASRKLTPGVYQVTITADGATAAPVVRTITVTR
jgi:hypothetical protein